MRPSFGRSLQNHETYQNITPTVLIPCVTAWSHVAMKLTKHGLTLPPVVKHGVLEKPPFLSPFSSTSSSQTLQFVWVLPFIREVLFIYDSRIKINIVIFQPAKLNYQRVAFQFFDVGTVRLTLHEQIERPELTDLAFQQRGSMENKHSQSFYHF